MFKKLRNLKHLSDIKKIEVRLAEVQGRIDYYKSDLAVNGDDSNKVIYSAMKLAGYLNEKVELINVLEYKKSCLQ